MQKKIEHEMVLSALVAGKAFAFSVPRRKICRYCKEHSLGRTALRNFYGIETIGPRLYAIYKCTMAHAGATFKVRLNNNATA